MGAKRLVLPALAMAILTAAAFAGNTPWPKYVPPRTGTFMFVNSPNAQGANFSKVRNQQQYRRCMMSRLGMAIRLMFCIPAVWFAMAVMAWAALVSSKEPLVDIALYAAERLAH